MREDIFIKIRKIFNLRNRRYIFVIYIPTLLILQACHVIFDAIKIDADQQKLTVYTSFATYYDGKGDRTKVKMIPEMKKFENICKSNNIEYQIMKLDDTTTNLKLIIPDFKAANRLAINTENYLPTKMFQFDFLESDSVYSVKMKLSPKSFTSGGTLSFFSKKELINVSPVRSTDLVNVENFEENSIIYTFYNQKEIKNVDSRQLVEIAYANNKHNLKKENLFLRVWTITFEEHFWATISSILTSILTFLTIKNFFKKK